MSSSINEIINKIYYDPKTGYIGTNALLLKVQQINPNITSKMVDEFLKAQYAVQVNKSHRKDKVFASIYASEPLKNVQMDIIVYDRYEYHKYKYILCIVDVYSRYAAARAMTSRSMNHIMTNFKDIMNKDFGGLPTAINCDNEFNKNEINKFAKDNNITMYYSEPDQINKNAIVERFNRTLTQRLQLWRTATGKYAWNKVLQDIISNYNQTLHSTLKATPYDVYNKRDINHQHTIILKNKFKVGDLVRLRIEKKTFSKDDILKYSKDVYQINDIVGQKIYLLNMTTKEIISKPVKPVQIISNNRTQNYINTSEESITHIKQSKDRKIATKVPQEGIESTNKREGLRTRAPTTLVEDDEYGRLIW